MLNEWRSRWYAMGSTERHATKSNPIVRCSIVAFVTNCIHRIHPNTHIRLLVSYRFNSGLMVFGWLSYCTFSISLANEDSLCNEWVKPTLLTFLWLLAETLTYAFHTYINLFYLQRFENVSLSKWLHIFKHRTGVKC